jgi:hypothetical protein
MKTKITLLIVSIIYCGYLLILLSASHYKSNILNPLNSEYYYLNGFLVKAIETEPSKAEYHMNYGLELLKGLPSDSFLAIDQLQLTKKELFRAVKLKPYSKLYKETRDNYVAWIDKQI